MAKIIPLTIRRSASFNKWIVVESRSGKFVDRFDSKAEAVEFVRGHKQNEDGEWEPDYEAMSERDEERGLARAERAYEQQFLPTAQDVGL